MHVRMSAGEHVKRQLNFSTFLGGTGGIDGMDGMDVMYKEMTKGVK